MRFVPKMLVAVALGVIGFMIISRSEGDGAASTAWWVAGAVVVVTLILSNRRGSCYCVLNRRLSVRVDDTKPRA